jgi:hypothetical protein
VTTRPEERVVAKLRGLSPDNMSVNAMDERNVDDLRRYIPNTSTAEDVSAGLDAMLPFGGGRTATNSGSTLCKVRGSIRGRPGPVRRAPMARPAWPGASYPDGPASVQDLPEEGGVSRHLKQWVNFLND